MADTNGLQGLIPSASPIASSGVDWEEMLASGDPSGYLAAHQSGVPFPLPTAARPVVAPPSPLAAAVGKPQAAVAPASTPAPATGTATNQPAEQDSKPYGMTLDNKSPMEGFGQSLAAGAQAQMPTTNAPNPPTDSTGARAVPSNVLPMDGASTGQENPVNPNNVQDGVLSLKPNSSNTSAPVDMNAVESRLAAANSPRTAANPTGVPQLRDPNDPNSGTYNPTRWQRFGRGLKAGLEGLAEHGIAGALMGAVDPAAVGATPYGAPTRAFSDAARRNAGMTANLQQQLTQGAANTKTAEEQARTESEQPIPITAAMGEENAALKPFVGTSLPASAVKTVAVAGVNTQGRKDIAGLNADERAAALGLKSTTGPDGKLTYSEDPDSPITKQKQALSDWRASIQKTQQLRAEIEREKITPGTPAFEQKQKQIDAEMKKANSYALRASGQMLGTDLEGNQLEGGATSAAGKPIGTSLAAPYIKQEGKTAQFNDVLGATDNIEKTAERLVQAGGQLNNPAVATAIADPKSTSVQWAQGAFATSGLSPEERDYVTNVKAYKENLQALRQSAGGGVSDAQVNRLMEMAPGASTPDLDYLKKQTGQIRLTANRLAEGLPQMKGGHNVRGGTTPTSTPKAPSPPPGATHAYTDKSGAVVGYAVNGKYQAVKK